MQPVYDVGRTLHAKLNSGLDKPRAAKTQLETLQKETETAIRQKIEGAKDALETKRKEAEVAILEAIEAEGDADHAS